MKKGAFTLVELIVVITILAILGTIAFISLQGYSSAARDSTRISDIGSIKKVLELYAIDNAKYPDPSLDIFNVTYSGSTVWTQGTFGDTVQQDTGKISVVPVDPLTKTRYAYSVLNTKKEYELGTILEGELSKLKTNSTNASGDKIMTSHVTGNYNGKVAKVEANSTTYILAVPTLINADLSETDYQTIVNNQSLAVKGTNTLPGSYTGTVAKLDGTNQTIINPSEIVIHTGDIDTIDNTTFVNNLQDAFSGTTSVNSTQIEELMSISSGEEDNYASNIINYNLGGNVVVNSTSGGNDSSSNLEKSVIFNTSPSYNYALYSYELQGMDISQKVRYVGCGENFQETNCGLTVGQIYNIDDIVKDRGTANYMTLRNDADTSYRTDLLNMPSYMKFDILDENLEPIFESNEVILNSTTYDYALYSYELEGIFTGQPLKFLGCGVSYNDIDCGLTVGNTYEIQYIQNGRGTGNYMQLWNDDKSNYRTGLKLSSNFKFEKLDYTPEIIFKTSGSYNYALYNMSMDVSVGDKLRYEGCGVNFNENTCGLTIGDIYEVEYARKDRPYDYGNYMRLWNDSKTSYRTDLLNMPSEMKFTLID